MRLALFALVVLSLAASSLAMLTSLNPNLDVSVSYVNTTYDKSANTTTFLYLVATGNAPVSHLLVSFNGSQCSAPVLTDLEWINETVTGDHSTGFKGFVYPMGQDPNLTVYYALTFNGAVPVGDSTVVVKSNTQYNTYTTGIQGPVCAGIDPSTASCSPTAGMQVECTMGATVPAPDMGLTLISEVVVTSELCSFDKDYQRTYATVVNGQAQVYTVCHQTHTIRDTHGPVVSGNFSSVTLGCNDPDPTFDDVTAYDACQGTITVPAPCKDVTNGTCALNNFTLWTWTATDACGNAVCKTKTVARVADSLPILIPPADNTTECTGSLNWPAVQNLSVSYDCPCDGNPSSVAPIVVTEPGECENTGTQIRTWQATDCCGNHRAVHQTLTVTDTTKPELWLNSPNNETTDQFECDNITVWQPQSFDKCMNGPAHVSNVTTRTNGSCPYNYFLTTVFMACDDCGNTQNLTSVVTIVDTTYPKWNMSSLPQNYSTECGNVTEVPDPTAMDNCGLVTVKRLNDTRANTSCPNEYILGRHWTASDECNHTIHWDQYVTVYDMTPTRINSSSIPDLGPFQCGSQVPPALKNVSHLPCTTPGNNPGLCNCDQSANLTTHDTIINGSCVNNYTIIRTYTLTDCSGNKDQVNKTIVVQDTTLPTFTNPPNDMNQTCNNTSPYPPVHMHDLCGCNSTSGTQDCFPVNWYQYRINGTCPWRYQLVNLWNTTNACGLTAYWNATITVFDNYQPTILNPPPNANYSCDCVPAKLNLSATAPCGNAYVNNSIPERRYNGSCSNQYRLERVWVAYDDCLNTASYTQTIFVDDVTAPVIKNVPSYTEMNCSAPIVQNSLCVSDNCGGVGLTYSKQRVNYTCLGGTTKYFYNVSRLWNASDACGNVATATQVVSVYDRDAPVWDIPPPSDVNTSCDNVTVLPPPGYSDACTTVTFTNLTSPTTPVCVGDYQINVVYKIVDACNNVNWWNYTIYVTDTTAPNITNTPPANPPPYTCAPPPPASPSVTDNCDHNPWLSAPMDHNVSVTCPNTFNMTRTWYANDSCNNPTSFVQFITVQDVTAPVWTSALPNSTVTYDCVPDAAQPLQSNDTCVGPQTAYPVRTNVSQNATCPYNYVYTNTWNVSDSCNNPLSFVQTVTVQDIAAPSITCSNGSSTCFQDQTDQCSPAAPPSVCTSDNCAGVQLDFNATTVNMTCKNRYKVVRKWVATDLCHNSATQSQTFTVYDSMLPSWITPDHDDQYSQCGLPQLVTPQAQDNCGFVNVTDHSHRVNGSCPDNYDWVVQYSAEDSCGNSIGYWNYTVHVYNNATPSVTWQPPPAPVDQNFTCAMEPVFQIPTVTDACLNAGSYKNWTVTTEPVQGNCSYIYTKVRYWNVTDRCDNYQLYTQTITGVHVIHPVFDSTPDDKNLTCGDSAPWPILTGTDSCGNNLTATNTSSIMNGSCTNDYYEYRVWTLTDRCNLQTSHTQVIHWYDHTAPVVLEAPDQPTSYDGQCSPVPPEWPTATDACTANPPVLGFKVNDSNPNQCKYVYTEHWYFNATDACNNTGYLNFTIDYTWDRSANKPTFYNLPPRYQELKCSDDLRAPNVTALDHCNTTLAVGFHQWITNQTCNNNYVIHRKWNTTDDCGATAVYYSTIKVYDKTDPELHGLPPHAHVQCGFVPKPADVCATDTCAGVSLNFSETILPNATCCDYIQLRTWVATDNCGNQASYTQTIVVYDDTVPVLITPVSLGCQDCANYTAPDYASMPNYGAIAYKPALATGYCFDGSITATPPCSPNNTTPTTSMFIVTTSSGPTTFTVVSGTMIEYVIGVANITATVQDSNGTLYDLSITLTNPVDSAHATTIFKPMAASCYNDSDPSKVGPGAWWFYQNMTGTLSTQIGHAVVATFSGKPSAYSQTGKGADYTTNYGVYLDGLANGDEFMANLDLVKDGQGSCNFSQTVFPQLCPCANVSVNFTSWSNTSCTGTNTTTYRWCAIDEVDHVVCNEQTIQICDHENPSLTVTPPETMIQCNETVPDPNVTSSDLCSQVTVTHNETIINSSTCANEYDVVRWYTATDNCGNQALAPYTVHVVDSYAPQISGVPASDVNKTCNDTWAPPNVCASDQCTGVNMTYTERNVSTCAYQFDLVRTWVAVDACGLPTTNSYTVHVMDPYTPMFTGVPNDTSVRCNDTLPTDAPTASHPCQGQVHVNGPFDTPVPNACGLLTITRVWNTSDLCGHSNSATQIITQYDDMKPVWVPSSLPQNQTVNCSDIPPVVNPNATDQCSQSVVVSYMGETSSAGPQSCSNSQILHRRWNATDCSGNSIYWDAYITVVDQALPTLTVTPPIANGAALGPVDCKNVTAPPSYCAHDNCDGVTLNYTSTRFNYTNNPRCDQYLLTRTALVTDECGNQVTHTYTLLVNNTAAPTCDDVAPDKNVTCENRDYVPPPPTCNSHCEGPIIPTLINYTVNGSCVDTFNHIYIYVATDSCGNSNSYTTTVFVSDHTSPQLHNIPADQVLECHDAIPPTNVTATDNCATPTPNYYNQSIPLTCPYLFTLLQSWNVTDNCGNVNQSRTVNWTWADSHAPSWNVSLPGNSTVECDAIPPVYNLTANDSCSQPTVNFSTWTSDYSCNNSYALWRQWVATDCVGHSITYVQLLNVTDTHAPSISPASDATPVQCPNDVVAPPSICTSDTCDGLFLDYTQTKHNLSTSSPTCTSRYYLNRTWVARDACGNLNSTTQIVVVNDTTAPTCPNATLMSQGPIPCEDRNNVNLDIGPCSDNCGQPALVFNYTTVTYGCYPTVVYNISYLVVDNCGNSVWYNQSAWVTDNVQLYLDTEQRLHNGTEQCNNLTQLIIPDYNASCGATPTFNYTYTNTSVPGTCQNYTREWHYYVYSPCGDVITKSKVVEVEDVIIPMFNVTVSNWTVNCSDAIIPPVVTANDSCGTATVVMNYTDTPGDCNNRWTRLYTWVATDLCGNQATTNAQVTVVDQIAPTITTPPDFAPVVNTTCLYIPPPPSVCCSDTCQGVYMNYTQTRVNGSCDTSYSLNRQWVCHDVCGNSATVTQVVNVTNDFQPEFTSPVPLPNSTVVYECNAILEMDNMTASTNCSDTTVTPMEVRSNGTCAYNYTLLRTWVAMDHCGHTLTYSQNATVQDTYPPVVIPPPPMCFTVPNTADAKYERIEFDHLTANGHFFEAYDNCSDVTITFVSCTSNQDYLIETVGDVGCVYDAANDSLTMSGLIDTSVPDGRMYTIVVNVTDACGYSVPSSRLVFLPFGPNSSSYWANLSLPDFSNCTLSKAECADKCPCQTVNHYCTETNSTSGISQPSVVDSGSSTTFSWQLTGTLPAVVVLGINLTQFEVLSVYPDGEHYGVAPGSVLSGIYWVGLNGLGVSQLNVTFAGSVASAPMNVQLFSGLMSTFDSVPANCSYLKTVQGPGALNSPSAVTVSGRVAVQNVVSSTTATFDVPLPGVLMGLYSTPVMTPWYDTCSTGSLLRVTLTDSHGAFSFRVSGNLSNYVVSVVPDAFFLPTTRSPNHFVRASRLIVAGDPYYGCPVSAASTPINLGFYLDDVQEPSYQRNPSATGFEGNALPVSVWKYCEATGQCNEVGWLFPLVQQGVSQLLGSCNSLATFSSSSTATLQNNLRAAAYNIASGRGIFDPYRQVQHWYFALGKAMFCLGSPVTSDQNLAITLLDLINRATDLDRY